MPEHLSVDTLAPEVDFNLLRREAIHEVARLAKDSWTDHNPSDPGITILEQLMFRMTDLGHKLNFDIKDLIASSDEIKKQFFSANAVLNDRPVTENDYRRLLLDHPQVRNAKLEAITHAIAPLYWDHATNSLTREASSTTELIVLKGLYRVLIETREEDEAKRVILKNDLQALLNSQRNLGERCAEVILLRPEVIKLRGNIELYEGVDVEETLVKLHGLINAYINPEIKFSSLADLRKAGMTTPDIYNGPVLKNGYLTENSLETIRVRTELRTSDIIRIILDQPEVKFVESLSISNMLKPSQYDWQNILLPLSSGKTPRLELINKIADAYVDADDAMNSRREDTHFVRFFKDEQLVRVDGERIKQIYKRIENEKNILRVSSENLPIPTGKKRDLDYVSVQNEFPEVYGIGEHGLPAKASPARRAQARQLKAYLSFFDQVFTNYNRQLGHLSDLFAVEEFSDSTYFAGEFDFVGSEAVLKASYFESLRKFLESDAISVDRQNRFLEHLLARHGIDFPDYSLLKKTTIEEVLPAKQYFLHHYPTLAKNRNLGMDYTQALDAEACDAPSGLKTRIAALLDIPHDGLNKPLISKDYTDHTSGENFYLVEHILLAHDGDLPDPYHRGIMSISSISGRQRTELVTANHGLADGEQIVLFNTTRYDGVYPIRRLNNNRFTLGFDLATEDNPQTHAKWCRGSRYKDVYSLLISYVLPDWGKRFADPEFRKTVEKVLRAETPAHIGIIVRWLPINQMHDFEAKYKQWLTDKTSNASGLNESANTLLKLLI